MEVGSGDRGSSDWSFLLQISITLGGGVADPGCNNKQQQTHGVVTVLSALGKDHRLGLHKLVLC